MRSVRLLKPLFLLLIQSCVLDLRQSSISCRRELTKARPAKLVMSCCGNNARYQSWHVVALVRGIKDEKLFAPKGGGGMTKQMPISTLPRAHPPFDSRHIPYHRIACTPTRGISREAALSIATCSEQEGNCKAEAAAARGVVRKHSRALYPLPFVFVYSQRLL